MAFILCPDLPRFPPDLDSISCLLLVEVCFCFVEEWDELCMLPPIVLHCLRMVVGVTKRLRVGLWGSEGPREEVEEAVARKALHSNSHSRKSNEGPSWKGSGLVSGERLPWGMDGARASLKASLRAWWKGQGSWTWAPSLRDKLVLGHRGLLQPKHDQMCWAGSTGCPGLGGGLLLHVAEGLVLILGELVEGLMGLGFGLLVALVYLVRVDEDGVLPLGRLG